MFVPPVWCVVCGVWCVVCGVWWFPHFFFKVINTKVIYYTNTNLHNKPPTHTINPTHHPTHHSPSSYTPLHTPPYTPPSHNDRFFQYFKFRCTPFKMMSHCGWYAANSWYNGNAKNPINPICDLQTSTCSLSMPVWWCHVSDDVMSVMMWCKTTTHTAQNKYTQQTRQTQ